MRMSDANEKICMFDEKIVNHCKCIRVEKKVRKMYSITARREVFFFYNTSRKINLKLKLVGRDLSLLSSPSYTYAHCFSLIGAKI